MKNAIKIIVKRLIPFYRQYKRITKTNIPFSYKEFVLFNFFDLDVY